MPDVLYVTVWQMESRCQRREGTSLSFQRAYPAVCVHQEERLWGVGHSWGWWLLHFFDLYHLLFCKLMLFCLAFDCSCACVVGDGRSRGAGFSHAAAGVLWRSVELSFSPAIRERRNPRAHHQTLQIVRISCQQFTQIHILVNKDLS